MAPKNLKYSRIRTKLLLIILLAGIPVILSVCFLLVSKYRTDYGETVHAVQVAADAIAHQHEAHVDGIRSLLITISQFPEVRKRDAGACNDLLQRILKQNPTSHNIGIADNQGNLLASGVQRKFSIGDRKYFKDALRTKRFSVGEYVVSRAVAKPAIHFALPVLDEAGEVSVVIYATFDLNNFNNFFDGQKLLPGSALNISDHRGVMLHRYPAHPTVKPGLQDRPDLRAHMTGASSAGVFREVGRDGVSRFLAFKRLQLYPDESPYLYIRVSIPEKEAMASVHRHFLLAIVLFAFASLVTIGCTHVLAGRFLVGPLERLAAVSKAARNADFSVRTGLNYADGEIGMLAQSLDAMSESLETRLREKEEAEKAQRRVEQALHESERRFREMLEKAHLVAVILDREGNITFCNDFFLSLTGWSLSEVIGSNWFDRFVSPEDGEELHRMFSEAIASARISGHHENPIVTRNGQLRSIVWDNTMLMNADGSVAGTASIGIDVTNHRNVEAQLLQAQKMEAVGKLAGGVAHDFNNLLTPILGYAEILADELKAFGGKIERVEKITQAALKARDLTRQLLTFGRKQSVDLQPLDLNVVVSTFADILRRTIRENIAIRLQLIPGPAMILADRTQVEQIIMNLVVNAQDAIDEKGDIAIETADVTVDEEFVRLHPDLQPGPYIMLAVSDTGHGIDREIADRIFEPFFTTKGIEKGTGLGLATVYGIVRQHGGTIWVYSEPGNGTVFKIYLPRIEASCAGDSQVLAAAVDAPRVCGTILVVEDNEIVRSLVREVLTICGHEVIVADGPSQALELLSGTSIDLLLTDIIMPDMSGPQLYRKILEADPGLKVLFMSGYTDNAVTRINELEEFDNFIQKPFAVDALASKVAAILAAGR